MTQLKNQVLFLQQVTTRCPKKNWELLLLLQVVTPSFFWDTLYLEENFLLLRVNFVFIAVKLQYLQKTYCSHSHDRH